MPRGQYLRDASPEERARISRMGGLTIAAKTDGSEMVRKARAASPAALPYWEAKVDPEGALSEKERQRRAKAAQRLYFTRLSRTSAKVRRKRPRPTLRFAREAPLYYGRPAVEMVPDLIEVLRDYADPETGEARVSVAVLSERLGWKPDKVARVREAGEVTGLLQVVCTPGFTLLYVLPPSAANGDQAADVT